MKKITKNRPSREEFRTRMEYARKDIASKIDNMVYSTGSYLPSESTLAEQYSLSKGSLKKILGQMEAQGIVSKLKGKGIIIGRALSNGTPTQKANIAILIPTWHKIEELHQEHGETPAERINMSLCILEEHFAQEGFSSQLLNFNQRKIEDIDSIINLMLEDNTQAIVVIRDDSSFSVELCKKAAHKGIACLAVNSFGSYCPMRSNVSCDNYSVGRIAVHYLSELGHKSMLCLGSDRDINWENDRIAGFKDTCASLKIDDTCSVFKASLDVSKITDDSWVEIGRLGAVEALKRKIITAIFCINDAVAAGAFETLRSHGVKIQEEISIIGCDNDYSYRNLELSTISLNTWKAAKTAAETILNKITQKQILWPMDLKICPSLIARSTTHIRM